MFSIISKCIVSYSTANISFKAMVPNVNVTIPLWDFLILKGEGRFTERDAKGGDTTVTFVFYFS